MRDHAGHSPEFAAFALRTSRSRRAAARPLSACCLTLLLSLAASRAMAADPEGSPTSREALALCHRAQRPGEAEPAATLERSLELADRAIASDGRDALAHFARFCALGEQARASGASLTSLFKLRSIRDAVDRTLELAPEFPDALLGKGALLTSLPGLLGGDEKEGERLVRRALAIDPEFVDARLFLVEILIERDQPRLARDELVRARAAATRKKDAAALGSAARLEERLEGMAD